jgi:hypothetical protein
MDENVFTNPEEIDKERLKGISDKIINNEKSFFSFYDKIRKKLGARFPSAKDPNSLELKDYLFLLPDFIPIMGYVDDFVVVILGIDLLFSEIDGSIISDNWSGKENIIDLVRGIKDKIEKNIQAPFLRNIKAVLKTFGVYNERDSDSN